MTAAKTKGNIVVYSHFFTATALMTAEAKAELWDALGKYINGEEPALTDAMAMMAWQFIRPQLDRDAEKWERTCVRNSENAKRRWERKESMPTDATVCDRIPNNATVCDRIPTDATGMRLDASRTIWYGDNDNDKDNDKDKEFSLSREHIARAPARDVSDSANEESKVWTLDDFRNAAKDPSVSLPESDVVECYDFYAAQGFVRGNGQPIISIAPLLRNWKRKRGEFEGRQTGGLQSQTVDEYSLQRAFEYLDGHFLGDYPDDPKGFEGLKQWAQKNGVYDRLRNRNDNLYRHVYKTGK